MAPASPHLMQRIFLEYEVFLEEQSMQEVSALNLRIAHTASQCFPLGSLKQTEFSSIRPRLRKYISTTRRTTGEKPTCS